MKNGLLCLFSLLLFAGSPLQQAQQWNATDAYVVKFSSRWFDGSFRGLKATIFFDENNPAGSKITASIGAATINTGIGLRNRHAMSENALNAKDFPEIRFESTRIIKTGTTFEVLGKLSLRAISKEIKIPFSFERSGNMAVFKGKFTISPKDFNVTRSGTPDAVDIELMVPVTR